MAKRSLLPDIARGEAFNPVREISRLQRNIDRMFEDFFSPFPAQLGRAGEELTYFSPPTDIEETDSNYLITFDLPGITKKDIRIECRDNQLIVSGERKEERERKEGNQLSKERFYGTFQRSFSLPANANADKIEANYNNGVLQVLIPKTEAAKAKQIEIKESKAA